MDDRTKKAGPAAEKSKGADNTPEESSESFVAYMNDPAEPLESGDAAQQEQRPHLAAEADRRGGKDSTEGSQAVAEGEHLGEEALITGGTRSATPMASASRFVWSRLRTMPPMSVA